MAPFQRPALDVDFSRRFGQPARVVTVKTVTPAAPRAGINRFTPAAVLLQALVTMALYWPVLDYGFINFDDPVYVTENPPVQAGLTWAGVKWAFTNTQQGSYWAPVMWLSHMVTCEFFGPDPWGHHLVNLLLHAANTALVFLVFRRLTGAWWRSLLLAALFGWHPLRVESVVWVTERKDVLSGLFWLLTLWAYVNYVRPLPRRPPSGGLSPAQFYWLALGCFALGLMSKAMLVTLPAVLLLLDWWPLERCQTVPWKILVREKIPFFLLALAVSAITFIAQKQGGAVMSMAGLSLDARVNNALISYCRYLGKLFWPTDLAIFYPLPAFWRWRWVLLAALFLAVLTAACWRARRRQPWLLVGWLWFLGTLLPVIQLIQAGEQSMADRFTYLPSLGIGLLVVWGAAALVQERRPLIAVGTAVAVGAVVLCLVVTRDQFAYWRNSETLFRHALAVTQSNFLAHNNLGYALAAQGRYDEAISEYNEAIRLMPRETLTRINLAGTYDKQGRLDDAVQVYQDALRLQPTNVKILNNLGVDLGRQRHPAEAARMFQAVLQHDPDNLNAHFNLGLMLLKQGLWDDAITQFQAVQRLNPTDPNAAALIEQALAGKAAAGGH